MTGKIFWSPYFGHSTYLLSRAINFGRQCHFKMWLDCHKFKKFPCLMTLNDLDDQNLLLATVHILKMIFQQFLF
jgi:hypothetical protein